MPEPTAGREPTLAHVAWSPDLLGYDFGEGHPMSPVRLDLTMRLARELGVLDAPGVRLHDVGPADDALLGTVHQAAYVAAVRRASADGVPDPARGLGTEDDPVFPGMHEASARIVGGSVAAATAVWRGEARHGVNVAGGMHHAMPGNASGFCVYNDASVAIRRLLDLGARRVAYVDLDAHHGDGVERTFWDDDRVLTVSVHETGLALFPGTGHVHDTGGPDADCTAVNVPLPPRTSGAGWLRAVRAVALPLVRAFRPDVVVSQHGCDAHGDDPLTHLAVSVDAQRAAAVEVHDVAHEVADGRWLALGGGGYAVSTVVPRVWTHVLAVAAHVPVPLDRAVPEGWQRYVVDELGLPAPAWMGDGDEPPPRPWSAGYDPADDVDRVVVAVRRAVFPHHDLDPLDD